MLYKDTSAIEAVNNGTKIPQYVRVGMQNVARLKYIRSDAWRGYWEAEAVKKSGWIKIDLDGIGELLGVGSIPGWVTGNWSDAPKNTSESELNKILEDYTKINNDRGYDTLIVFTPTSNVFSTTYSIFAKKRGRLDTIKRRKLANNTYLIDNGKRRAVRLHSTDIATEAGPGRIRIDTGGWDTMTTRERLHRFTTCRVWRDKGVTYVDGIKLKDGMIVPGSLAL